MNKKYSNLFEPFTFKNGFTVKNRIVMAPMTTWASNDDFTISDEEVNYYKVRSHGAGLIITGCTHVQPNGIGFENGFAGYDDKFTPSLRNLANATKSGGSPSILQIFHAGNKALPFLIPDGEAVSASAVKTETTAFAPALLPRELSSEEIMEVIHAFKETTRRAIEAGFDGVEIHGAHGFLIQNFVSPFFNRREDEWGGSLENRLRFPLEVMKEIKRVIKAHATKPFILGYRLSLEEPNEGGLRLHDTHQLINRLIEFDIDYIHVSLQDALYDKPINSQDEKTLLELTLEHVNGRVPVMAAGSMLTPDSVSMTLDKGLSFVALGHAFVMNPDWVEKVQNEKEDDIMTSIKVSKVNELELPQKLWSIIQASVPWFNIES